MFSSWEGNSWSGFIKLLNFEFRIVNFKYYYNLFLFTVTVQTMMSLAAAMLHVAFTDKKFSHPTCGS